MCVKTVEVYLIQNEKEWLEKQKLLERIEE